MIRSGPNRRISSSAGAAPMPLSSPAQSRYKGLTNTPGVVKFSQWKRENTLPKIPFHEYILQKIRETDPSRIWLKDVTLGRAEPFGRVSSSVAKIASGLNKIGFGARDVMCMYCSNYVEYWLMALAAWTCGGCVMPVNCEMEIEQLEVQLIEADAKILVCDDYNVDDAVDLLEGTKILKHIIVIGSEGKAKGCIPVSDLMEDDGKCPPPKTVGVNLEKDTVYLPFTSSSSGNGHGSKGIMHTHRSLLAWFFCPDNMANHYIDQMVGDSIACGNWFFHMSGIYPVLLSAIHGVTCYCLSEYSDKAFLSMITDHKAATATLYPWQIRLLSQSPIVTKYDLSCLKSILTTGGVLSATIRMELLERFPTVKYVREAYGTNECGLVTLTYPREKKNSIAASKMMETPDDHVMPVGLPNMYTQIKITNRQNNEAVEGADMQGEICVKSPQNFIGYLNYRHNQQLFDSEGYYRTGDLGYYDSQGVIYFIEKIENLIHFWMYEVAPNILESRLLGSNNIVDAAVVGIPNKENGEVPRAFVVLKPSFEETEENLTNLMESRLQDHERIRGGLYFVQSIPRDENWKILKDVLKAYQPSLAYEATPEEEPPTVGKSPKTPKKVVKELAKQANGAFVAAAAVEEPSPRSKRKAKKSGGGLDVPVDSQDIFGMRSRSRRGSMECILEDGSSAAAGELQPKAIVGGTIPSPNRRRSIEGLRSRTRRGSGSAEATPPVGVLVGSGGVAGSAGTSEGMFSYWMQVNVHPPTIEAVIQTHPAVKDCCVQGFLVPGIGHLPRAYIALKGGYEASSEEILNYAHLRLADTDRLRGGIVFLEKLAKDSTGKILVNLDKHDKHAEGVDYDFIKNQPKVKI